MIRFVYIGDQINEGEREFAFFNTVNDQFVLFKFGEHVFDSVADFEEVERMQTDVEFFERCKRLIPDWYKTGGTPILNYEEQ